MSVEEMPRDGLPVEERAAVRVVVVDGAGRVLLFHTHELTRPDLGTWWELPGGGIDPGESYAQTAVRELREETGIVVAADQVGPANWRRRATFIVRGTRRLQDEVVVAVHLPGAGPGVDVSGRLPYEVEDYFGFRWWPAAEVAASAERFYPGRLPRLLPAFLRGEEIDEPFEVWI